MIDKRTMPSTIPTFRLRSFVRRNGRKTASQKRAYAESFAQFGLLIEHAKANWQHLFTRSAPRLLEIGFGTGQSLLALAKARPDLDFIGVETHQPGIGSLLLGIEQFNLDNIRIFEADVIDVLAKAIPDASLDGVQIFFPDPWPKRRHHLRRLIQAEFVHELISKLKMGASLHLATDWEDYAKHMMQVLAHEKRLINLAGIDQFTTRSPYRPIITKFEQRALRAGRQIFDLQFCYQG